ncbi:MAG: hypothetical protein K2P90_04815 [Holosporales bacterium]|nr:hypothetical protein [Holosporales bacterium]
MSTSPSVLAVELIMEEEELLEETNPQESEDPETQKISSTHNLTISNIGDEKEE